MRATGSSVWSGTFHEGSGSLSAGSGVVREAPYTFASRFEGAPGASPEELLAAGHAGCYNHALANILDKRGKPAGSFRTRVDVDLGTEVVSPRVLGVRITVDAEIPGLSDAEFQEYAARAGRTCAISRALAVEVTVEAALR
ncbi:OsmC family peroxiredoxin [Streptomyces sp. P6-2-1]|uniref:OsmC family peroxiredoxin n=1 Tax=unclassified Streptomyces TaxID=2593676 RepID=UPI003D36F983